VYTEGGQWLACAEGWGSNGAYGLHVVQGDGDAPPGERSPTSWSRIGTVVESADPSVELANCHICQANGSVLLAAWRQHLYCIGDDCAAYTLCAAASLDGGRSWGDASTILISRTGVWEPFLLPRPDGSVQVYYARETNGPDVSPRAQQIVSQWSRDGLGQSWTWPPMVVVATDNSRPGMPGVTALPTAPGGQDLVVVFEETVPGDWAHFHVGYAVSRDGGVSWPERGTVYSPAVRNAGAPQVAYAAGSGQLVVSFMTNDDDPLPPPPWPNGAFVKVAMAPCSATSCTPLVFGPPQVVAAPEAWWPGVFAANGSVYCVLAQNNTAYITSQKLGP
jgi:hypothetical protein